MLFSLFIKVPILYKISYKNTNLFHQLLCFTHQLLPAGPRPLARSCQNRQASSQLLPARPGTAAHTPRQNRQASRHGGSSFSQGPGKTPFCQNRQASSYPQVIHSLWESYPQPLPMILRARPKNLGPRSI